MAFAAYALLHVEMCGHVWYFFIFDRSESLYEMYLLLRKVLDLISSDNLNVPSEEEVYRAVLSWVKHDVDGRRQHVPWVILIPSYLTLFPSTI